MVINRRTLLYLILAAVVASFGPLPVFAQDAGHLATDKAIRYVAGKDGKWFTKDDMVTDYFVIEHDGPKTVKRTHYGLGPDGLPFTADDEVLDYQTFDYDPAGRPLKEVSYSGTGETKNESVVTSQDKLVQQNVEYVGTEINSVRKFEYDKAGRMTRMFEYQAAQGGKGPDGRFLTPDDVVTAVTVATYRGRDKIRDVNYSSPGPDGKWGTRDDVKAWYIVYEYTK